MKKISYLFAIYFISSVLLLGCNKDDELEREPTPTTIDFSKVEIQDFIWGGLNLYYLWKDNVPNLADYKNDNAQSYFNLLDSYSDPSDFFESLIYNRETVDRWSWIVDDYVALENSFQGISKSNGVEFRLTYESGSDTNLLGYVRYVLPDSDASEKDVKRGYIFDAINGTQLTLSNYEELIELDSYTMNFADLNGGNLISNGKSVTLTKSEYHENPVYVAKTFDINGTKIGYLMYNQFASSYDQQLNAAFGQLKTEGASELVLDLRYNGGGSITSSIYLASMITGQFDGELFAKERWNTLLQEYFESNYPDRINNFFTNEIIKKNNENEVILRETLNSMNLSKVYIIATGSSASASELVINGLKPYIDVVTIGTTTHGKYTGSVTLYDSDNLNKTGDNLNPDHKYAIQPIVLETVNKNGISVKGGVAPTYTEIEYISEMETLGIESEPLLAKAIELITGVVSKSSSLKKEHLIFEKVFDSKDMNKFGKEMYVDKELPWELINR